MTGAAVLEPPAVSARHLLGSAPEFRRDQLAFYETALRRHGDLVRINLGPRGIRVVAYGLFHPQAVQHVLTTNAPNYRKDTPTYREIAAQFGEGLLTSQDERWKRQRRLLQPLFTHLAVADYVHPMAEEAQRLVTDRLAAGPGGRRVELYSTLLEHAMRTLGRVLLGTVAEHGGTNRANTVCQELLAGLSRHAFRRSMSPVRLPAIWPTPGNRYAARAREQLRRVAEELITLRRATGDFDSATDLVALLLRAVDPETGEGLTAAELRDQVLIFLLAGHETAATALTFTLHLLGRYPTIQDLVRQEADTVLAGRPPGAADLPKLPYTAMVVREALRLYPPAYATGRVAVHDDMLGPYRIPAGAQVIISPWVTHRHPGFWTDPARFDPERFRPGAESARPRYAYFPFGAGPRACIGSRFALAEAVIGTAAVVSAYRLRTPAGPVSLATGITLRPAGPLWCDLSPR